MPQYERTMNYSVGTITKRQSFFGSDGIGGACIFPQKNENIF